MKTKIISALGGKIYLFAAALFFLSVFFVGVDRVENVAKAADYNICVESGYQDMEACEGFDIPTSNGAENIPSYSDTTIDSIDGNHAQSGLPTTTTEGCDPDPSCWWYNCCSSPDPTQSGGSGAGNGTGAGSFVMCANGMVALTCTDAAGNLVPGIPVVTGSGNGGGPGNIPRVVTPKCGTSGTFQEIGGVCFPTNTGLANPQGGIGQILTNLFFWLMGLFTTFAVIAFVISGIQYFMASGDESMAEKAKENATHAVVGIIIGFSGFIIIKAISAALTGQSMFF